MLKKVKLRIAAWGITGVIGAGSLFSGIAAQNVCAQEGAAVESVNENTEYSVNTEISGQINETQDSYSDTSAYTLQSNPVTEENTPSDSTGNNSTAIENEAETESSEVSFKENTIGSDDQNNDNTKEFSGTRATKDTKAVKAKNGWVKESGGYKYYKNGRAYTGWHKMGKAEGEKTEHYSYFGSDGIVRTGWQSMGKGTGNSYDENTAKHMCYFGKDGWLRTGWIEFGKGTKESDGNSTRHWSYFGSNGWLRTGWVQFGKGTSDPDGNSAKHWSYFGANGWLRTGWVQFGKGTSEPDGDSTKHWSFFGDNGWMRKGLQSMGRGTSNPDGNSPKHLSYFGDNGWLRVNTQVNVNNKTYNADGNGWLIEKVNTTPTKNTDTATYHYVLNKNSKIFHISTCASVNRMSEKNKQDYYGNRDQIISQGYTPCHNCNP